MKPSVLDKLQSLSERLEEVTALLSTPEATADINRFRQLNQEHAELTPVVEAYPQHKPKATLPTLKTCLPTPK